MHVDELKRGGHGLEEIAEQLRERRVKVERALLEITKKLGPYHQNLKLSLHPDFHEPVIQGLPRQAVNVLALRMLRFRWEEMEPPLLKNTRTAKPLSVSTITNTYGKLISGKYKSSDPDLLEKHEHLQEIQKATIRWITNPLYLKLWLHYCNDDRTNGLDAFVSAVLDFIPSTRDEADAMHVGLYHRGWDFIHCPKLWGEDSELFRDLARHYVRDRRDRKPSDANVEDVLHELESIVLAAFSRICFLLAMERPGSECFEEIRRGVRQELVKLAASWRPPTRPPHGRDPLRKD